MHTLPIILAELQFEDFLYPLRHGNGSARDYFLILGAVAALTGVLVLLILGIRKLRRGGHRHHHHHHHHSGDSLETAHAASSDTEPGKHRRRRRRRREHRPRNPTLAETGGLPPIRPDNPLDPSS